LKYPSCVPPHHTITIRHLSTSYVGSPHPMLCDRREQGELTFSVPSPQFLSNRAARNVGRSKIAGGNKTQGGYTFRAFVLRPGHSLLSMTGHCLFWIFRQIQNFIECFGATAVSKIAGHQNWMEGTKLQAGFLISCLVVCFFRPPLGHGVDLC
jgi:hypothetical protein